MAWAKRDTSTDKKVRSTENGQSAVVAETVIDSP
jgi:hypothetical protein